MRKYFICNRSQVFEKVRKHEIDYILSLVDLGKIVYLPKEFNRNNHKIINFRDEEDPNLNQAPRFEDIKNILEWGKNLPENTNILVHCEAGISRSTAATLSLLVQEKGLENIIIL